MGEYQKHKVLLASPRITLNSLKDELHSLNMRMLLAMQNHDEYEQEKLEKKMAEVQGEINRMNLGGEFKMSPKLSRSTMDEKI